MGAFFTAGETKVRPGVYQRYENNGGGTVAGALNGVVAIAITSNWGKLGEVHKFGTLEEAYAAFGTGGTNGTVYDIAEVFQGGASEVKAVRLGTGGTKAVAALADTAGTPATAVTVTAKYEGSRAFTHTVRNVLGDSASRELIIYDGTTAIEKYTFTAGGDEASALVAVATTSPNFTIAMASEYEGTGTLAAVTGAAFSAGTDPTIANSDYSAAFLLLEPEQWNTICVDTNEVAVHALLSAFVERVFTEGKLGMAVVGEPVATAIATRQSHAAAFNDYKTVFMGGGWYNASNELINGHRAAARIAGMIAAVPSSESVTRKPIDGAVRLAETLTNTQYETCIRNGMLTVSTSSTGTIWIESGINTLVTISGEDDEGWKKIKRTKIRFELMQRANDSTEPLIGNIPNNTDGLSTVIKTVQGVLNDMIAESKLLPGAKIEVDTSKTPVGDSAWFIITADDVDSLEKVYFLYRFRFSPNA